MNLGVEAVRGCPRFGSWYGQVVSQAPDPPAGRLRPAAYGIAWAMSNTTVLA
jgi:hypothetical protein